MNDNPNTVDLPMVAEAKETTRPSQQLLAIKREIMTYAGAQAHFIEQVEDQARIIEEQKSTITEMQKEMDTLRRDANLGKFWCSQKDELVRFQNSTNQFRNRLESDLSTAKKAIGWLEDTLEYMDRCNKQTESYMKLIEEKFSNNR